jgi:hypothetical protein
MFDEDWYRNFMLPPLINKAYQNEDVVDYYIIFLSCKISQLDIFTVKNSQRKLLNFKAT